VLHRQRAIHEHQATVTAFPESGQRNGPNRTGRSPHRRGVRHRPIVETPNVETGTVVASNVEPNAVVSDHRVGHLCMHNSGLDALFASGTRRIVEPNAVVSDHRDGHFVHA
jgi:hypothetical protein